MSKKLQNNLLSLSYRVNRDESLQAFNVNEATLKVFSLEVNDPRFYFEIEGFENDGVTVSLYKALNGLHNSLRLPIEHKQYTFRNLGEIPLDFFKKTLEGLQGIFK